MTAAISFSASIVRVLKPNGSTAGTGFVISDDALIATCAHVLLNAGSQPGKPIRLEFRLPDQSKPILSAWVDADYLRKVEAEDTAILRLEGPLPNGVQRLSLGRWNQLSKGVFKTFGFPAKYDDGLLGEAHILGNISRNGLSILQLRSPEITRGFSGAPVWDEVTGLVVGMVDSVSRPDEQGRLATTTFITPSETLQDVCSVLSIVEPPLWIFGGLNQPSTPLRHFVTLDEYLARPGPRFPKISDFEQGLVYFSQNHASLLEKSLGKTGRCLLIGRSAAGKTVLALAFAKYLQDSEGYQVFYGDAGRAQEGDGRAWYQEIATRQGKDTLYILDNCHLALDEVNQFCFQFERILPWQVRILLLSRAKLNKHNADTDGFGDYFEIETDSIVEIKPEEIYRGVLERYATAYRQQDPSRYIALENDSASVLEAQHAHNLVASRSRLEVWYRLGGRLSEVTQDAIYNELTRKYLSQAKEALLAICALWQYEIYAHNVFIEKELDVDSVKQLEGLGLLNNSLVPNYGVLYRASFHPEEARAILEAGIFRQWGHADLSAVEAETIRLIRIYLCANPPNYLTVYDALYHHQKKNIEFSLMIDENLQACAASQFRWGRISDTAKYLFNLFHVDRDRGRKLLTEFVESVGMENLGLKMQKCTPHEFQFALFYFNRLDAELTQTIVANTNVQFISNRIDEDSFINFTWFVKTLQRISPEQTLILLEHIPLENLAAKASVSNYIALRRLLEVLVKLGYPNIHALLKAIDFDLLVQHTGEANLDYFKKLAKTIRNLSPEIAAKFLKSYNQKTTAQDLALMMNKSFLPTIGQLVHDNYSYYKDSYKLFYKQFLPQKLSRVSWKQTTIFLKWLKQIPEVGNTLMVDVLDIVITNSDLLSKIVHGTLADVTHLLREVSTLQGSHLSKRELYFSAIRQVLLTVDLTNILREAKLYELGLLIQYVFEYVDEHLARKYCRLIDRDLDSKTLFDAPAEDLIHFLWRLTIFSDLPQLHILDNPALLKRMTEIWSVRIEQGARLLGIIVITKPEILGVVQLSPLTVEMRNFLSRWLPKRVEKQSSDILVLFFHGLRAYNEADARKAARTCLSLEEVDDLIANAIDSAPTPRALALLQETQKWISGLLFEETIEMVDQLREILGSQ